MSQPLTTILITRPMGQQQAFSASCSKLGLGVAHLPCLAIEPLLDHQLSAQLLRQCDSVLFTSKNAVIHAHRCWPMPWLDTTVNSIGPATTAALAALNQPVELTANPPFTSESYLQQLERLPPQTLLIIKGSGGRTLIAERLRELGWSVQGADVYQRSLPAISTESVTDIIQNSAPDIISITSGEALHNLKILAHNHWDTLCKLPLIVNSERTATQAQSIGFEQPAMVAVNAGDEGQLEQVKCWLSKR
jgi:uroporphyrinogen-III synthase